MEERPNEPATGAIEGMGTSPTPPPRPRWVKVSLIIALVGILLVVIVLLVAGGHGPGRHGSTPVPEGVGEPADAVEADRQIDITTRDTMTFEPSTVRVAAGETVTFVVTNAGRDVHEFTLGNAAMQREHADAMEHMPSGMAHDTHNSITVQPGATKQLTWRFGDTTTLEFACHQPGHYQSGMHGRITIT